MNLDKYFYTKWENNLLEELYNNGDDLPSYIVDWLSNRILKNKELLDKEDAKFAIK